MIADRASVAATARRHFRYPTSRPKPMTAKSILIVNQDRKLVNKLTRRCRQLGFAVRKAHSAFAALKAMDEELPALVCLDINIPTGNDLSLCQMMETDEHAARIPVIALAHIHDEVSVRRCGQMCAYHLRKTSNVDIRLEPFISELLVYESGDSTAPLTTDG